MSASAQPEEQQTHSEPTDGVIDVRRSAGAATGAGVAPTAARTVFSSLMGAIAAYQQGVPGKELTADELVLREHWAPFYAFRERLTFTQVAVRGAAAAGNLEVLSWLVEVARVSTVGAIEAAVAARQVPALAWLMATGCRPTPWALEEACRTGAADVVRQLLVPVAVSRAGTVTRSLPITRWAITNAVASGDAATVEALLFEDAAAEGGGPKLRRDPDIKPDAAAMNLAAGKGYVQILNLLVEAGGNANAETVEAAAKEGKLDAMVVLAAKGAPITDTAVELLTLAGHAAGVQLLLAVGAEPTDAMLEIAARNGYVEIVKSLLERGVAATPRAVELAAEAGHTMVLVSLLEHGGPATPLAVLSGARNLRPGILAALLRFGGNPSDDALNAAIEVGESVGVHLIASKRDEPPADHFMHRAARLGKVHALEALAAAGGRVNVAVVFSAMDAEQFHAVEWCRAYMRDHPDEQ